MTGIYNTRFIYYDDAGKVLEIRPFPPEDSTLYLEIDFILVEDFLFGRKSYSNYKIDYFFNLVNGIANEEETLVSEETKFLYLIPKTTAYNNEITIEHKSNSWNIVVREDIKEKIKLYPKIDFFICKKDDPSFLYSKVSINLQESYSINFTTDVEKSLKEISVIILKQFKSYGIKETYE